MAQAPAAATHGDQDQVSTEELLQGQLELWHHALGFVRSMAFKCAMDLRIADAIHRCGGAATLPDILAATGIPPARLPYLGRLMRVLTVSRLFAVRRSDGDGQDEAVYELTAASRLLVSGQGSPNILPFIHPLVEQSWMSPFFGMHAWFTDESAAAATSSLFEMAHGKGFFWEMARNEEFNETTVSDSRLTMQAVLSECPGVFRGASSLVDVGGGYGAAAVAVAAAFPHVSCSVLDLPHVVAKAPGGGGNVVFVAGDMFEHIPPADLVLLQSVLHDWHDDDCVKILRRCRKAIPPRDAGGKVVIIDIVIGSRLHDNICKETQVSSDLLMMCTLNQGRTCPSGEAGRPPELLAGRNPPPPPGGGSTGPPSGHTYAVCTSCWSPEAYTAQAQQSKRRDIPSSI